MTTIDPADHALVYETDITRPPDWPLPLQDHLSPSQVSEFLICPEKWRLARIQNIPTHGNVHLLIGTADTRANEQNMRHVIETEEMLPVADVKDAARDAFQLRLEEDGGESEVDWDGQKPGEAQDKAILVAQVYRENVAASVKPVAVEERVEIQLPGQPLLYGYADVVEEDRVIEKKTSSSLKRNIEPHWRPTALLYAAATQKPVAFHVTTKAKSPTVTTPETDIGLFQPIETARAEALVVSVADALRTLVETKGPDNPWPGHGLTHGWACNLCPFKEQSCRWWRA